MSLSNVEKMRKWVIQALLIVFALGILLHLIFFIIGWIGGDTFGKILIVYTGFFAPIFGIIFGRYIRLTYQLNQGMIHLSVGFIGLTLLIILGVLVAEVALPISLDTFFQDLHEYENILLGLPAIGVGYLFSDFETLQNN